jgi:hypothetical protein
MAAPLNLAITLSTGRREGEAADNDVGRTTPLTTYAHEECSW